ncbi:hypothetical protein SLOPH_1031 [Spraguea lophii 42_110]|uniref:Uncharacterized protein n=1 Tax=Spraguea lophii (strain 42_110) TaxID=1358809 RepID=S7W7C0_SPRLO|nr:hypothetical protein SLOPH_1031 [Spraguea lophii 42_110]
MKEIEIENLNDHILLDIIETPSTILNYKLEYKIPINSSKGILYINDRFIHKLFSRIINLELLCIKYNKLVYALSIDIYNKEKIEHKNNINKEITTFEEYKIIEYNFLKNILHAYTTDYDKNKNIKEILNDKAILNLANKDYINIYDTFKSVDNLITKLNIDYKYKPVFHNFIGINNTIIKNIEDIEEKDFRVTVLKENKTLLFLEMNGNPIDFKIIEYLALS